MKKQATVVGSLFLTLLIATGAWSAPRTGKAKPTKPVPLDMIQVSTDDGGHGGGYGGAGSSWTLRSNDTMDHSESVTPADSMQGAEGLSLENGAMPAGSFNRMLGYLQWTRLLDLKAPAVEGAGVEISLVRKGKTKRVRLSYWGGDKADAAIWTTMELLKSLESGIDWKNKQGLSLNTGMDFDFSNATEGIPESVKADASTLSVVVVDSNNKEVGTASVHSAAWADTVVARPGTYRLRVKVSPEHLAPEGYLWRVTPETAVVIAGQKTKVKVTLQKKPVMP